MQVNESKKAKIFEKGQEFVIHNDGFRDKEISDRYCGDGLIKFGRRNNLIKNQSDFNFHPKDKKVGKQ
jgi:hypothetical protein